MDLRPHFKQRIAIAIPQKYSHLVVLKAMGVFDNPSSLNPSQPRDRWEKVPHAVRPGHTKSTRLNNTAIIQKPFGNAANESLTKGASSPSLSNLHRPRKSILLWLPKGDRSVGTHAMNVSAAAYFKCLKRIDRSPCSCFKAAVWQEPRSSYKNLHLFIIYCVNIFKYAFLKIDSVCINTKLSYKSYKILDKTDIQVPTEHAIARLRCKCYKINNN